MQTNKMKKNISINKLLKEIEEARKDKEFIRELKIFIKETS